MAKGKANSVGAGVGQPSHTGPKHSGSGADDEHKLSSNLLSVASLTSVNAPRAINSGAGSEGGGFLGILSPAGGAVLVQSKVPRGGPPRGKLLKGKAGSIELQ